MEGNPGKQRINRCEPMPQRGRPACPPWLDAAAKSRWKSLVPELDRLGLLTIVDGDALAAYCQAWAEFQWATKTLQKEGRVFSTETGYLAPHPAVAQQRSAMQQIRAFAALFGLNPADRGKLGVSSSEKEADPLEDYLRKCEDKA